MHHFVENKIGHSYDPVVVKQRRRFSRKVYSDSLLEKFTTVSLNYLAEIYRILNLEGTFSFLVTEFYDKVLMQRTKLVEYPKVFNKPKIYEDTLEFDKNIEVIDGGKEINTSSKFSKSNTLGRLFLRMPLPSIIYYTK
jgi:hypothetical protein